MTALSLALLVGGYLIKQYTGDSENKEKSKQQTIEQNIPITRFISSNGDTLEGKLVSDYRLDPTTRLQVKGWNSQIYEVLSPEIKARGIDNRSAIWVNVDNSRGKKFIDGRINYIFIDRWITGNTITYDTVARIVCDDKTYDAEFSTIKTKKSNGVDQK